MKRKHKHAIAEKLPRQSSLYRLAVLVFEAVLASLLVGGESTATNGRKCAIRVGASFERDWAIRCCGRQASVDGHEGSSM